MKSSLDVLEGLNRKLNIEIPENMVSDAFNRMYKGIQKEANIKGFRKVKAPISAIKKLYKDRVQSDVLQNIVSDSYESALNEHSLDPISQPQLPLTPTEKPCWKRPLPNPAGSSSTTAIFQGGRHGYGRLPRPTMKK